MKRKLLIKAYSGATVRLGRALARRSDVFVIRALALAQRLMRAWGAPAGAVASVADVEDIMRSEPVFNQAIRNLILDARESQLRSLVRGLLRHYLLPGGTPRPPVARVTWPIVREGRPMVVALLGEGLLRKRLRAVYETRPDCVVVDVPSPMEPADRDSLFRDIAGLEIVGADEEAQEWAQAALARGIPVSVHHGALGSDEAERRLVQPPKRGRALSRIFHPTLAYPPVRTLLALVRRGEVGEVATVRVRATIGGAGGTHAPEPPPRDNYLSHPAFDQIALLEAIGGPIESRRAYLNPMDPARGGQGLVALRFEHAGRVGLLECVWAPGLFIRSEEFPYDLDVEVAGTDGIVWLRRGMGERAQVPAILVRAGKTSYTIGVESGLDCAWSAVDREAAGSFVRLMREAARR